MERKFYIIISELPPEQQSPFKKWLVGQTRPVVEEAGEDKYNCAYIWDYKNWFSHWEKGLEAPWE